MDMVCALREVNAYVMPVGLVPNVRLPSVRETVAVTAVAITQMADVFVIKDGKDEPAQQDLVQAIVLQMACAYKDSVNVMRGSSAMTARFLLALERAQGMENAIKVQSDANVRRGSVVRIAQRLYVHLLALGTGTA